jgi:hypothetical protein
MLLSLLDLQECEGPTRRRSWAQKTVVTRADVSNEPIRILTVTLMEDRDEISRAIPQAYVEVRPAAAFILARWK